MAGRRTDHLFGAPRFCQTHNGRSATIAGKWIESQDGKTRRWICESCIKAQAARKGGGDGAAMV